MHGTDAIGQKPQTGFAGDDLPEGHPRDLYLLWQARCNGRKLPSRGDFNPEDLPATMLPWIAILDVVEGGERFRIRVVGTGIVDAIGIEATGRHVDEFPGAEAVEKRVRWLARTRTPYFVAEQKVTWGHNTFRRYSALGLPLASDGATVDMLLYGMFFSV